MSDVLSEYTVDCHTLQDVACSNHCAIAVTFNFDQLPMTHTIERQKKNKHINWEFEDVGLKRKFYQRLDCMLDAAPERGVGDGYFWSTGARTQIGLLIC